MVQYVLTPPDRIEYSTDRIRKAGTDEYIRPSRLAVLALSSLAFMHIVRPKSMSYAYGSEGGAFEDGELPRV